MDRQLLTSEELSAVIRRAQEIDAAGSTGDLAAYVDAAEEAGISREATMQALRERLGNPLAAAQTGEMVFARSADGHFYAAKVDAAEGDVVKVKFLNGAESRLPVSDLRELDLTPGQKLNYMSPSMAMWCNANVRSVNRDAMTVDMESWGTTETVALDKIRLLSQNVIKGASGTASFWAGKFWWLLGGIGIGVVLERLLIR